MNLNHLILKVLVIFTLPYYITTKFIHHHNGLSLNKKIDSKSYSLEMVNIPNLEPNINRNSMHQSMTDNFIRRIPLYTYTPYFLGYLDEHERKENHAEASNTKLQHIQINNDDVDFEIRDALTLNKNDENSRITKLKKVHDDDVKEALEIIKKIAVQKSSKQQNKSKLKKSIKKIRNDDELMSESESAELFTILKNGKQPKPIKTKTRKTILIDDDDDDDAASYLQIYNNNNNNNKKNSNTEDEIIGSKRGKRFDEIIENNPYELLKALISHESRLADNSNIDNNQQGACKYLELANILGCLGNNNKINNICKSILSGCNCKACQHNKSASELVLNYTNLTADSESEEDKFHYEHVGSDIENKDLTIKTNNDFVKELGTDEENLKGDEMIKDQIEKIQSKENVEVNKSDNDFNHTLEKNIVNDENKQVEKSLKINEEFPTEKK